MDRELNTMQFLNKDISTPTISYDKLHEEESGNEKLNKYLYDISVAINNINIKTKTLSEEVNSYLDKSITRLDTVLNTINLEKERLQDVTMLCNLKTDFDNVINIKETDLSGDFGHRNNMYFCEESSTTKVPVEVINITGNGYEGNEYVLLNDEYLKDNLPTFERNKIIDNNINTFWEYSRITASNTDDELISNFNTDSSEAKCTITFKFEEAANELVLHSSLNSVKVTNVRYSNNNIEYTDLNTVPFKINDKEESYNNDGYVYGNNILSFPSSSYLKVTFESTSYLDEDLAFEKTIEINDKLNTSRYIVESAKRHVIRLNNIEAFTSSYITPTNIVSRELIDNMSQDIYSISLFANTYIPYDTPEDTVKFILTVNGEDIEVIPINNHGNGTKLIRFSEGKLGTEYTKYIGEKITSAFLTIIIKSNKKNTPYINNLKILIGGDI